MRALFFNGVERLHLGQQFGEGSCSSRRWMNEYSEWMAERDCQVLEEITIRHGRGWASRVRIAVLFALLWIFLAGTVALALFNLVSWDFTSHFQMIASMIWPCLVAALLGGTIIESGGWRRSLVLFRDHFASRRIAQVRQYADGRRTLFVGHNFRGRAERHFEVELDGIEWLWWHEGQASNFTGRDCGDWSIALWCRPDAVTGAPKQRHGSTVLIVPREGTMAATDEFASEFIALLERAGMKFNVVDRKATPQS
jgi:hypothetical protein